MAKKKQDYIFTIELTLEEFLRVIDLPAAEKKYYPIGRFPSETHLDEFLSTIHDRSEKEFRDILRHFIPKSCTYGHDIIFRPIINRSEEQFLHNKSLEEQAQTHEHYIKDTEYFRRLSTIKSSKDNVWEGMTWVIDLLPHFPNEAIKALDAYFQANCQFLPDDPLYAISDCTSMIRARYIDKDQPRDIFLNLSPKDFEKLVASLYQDIGYKVSLTKDSHDGGIDIYAQRNSPASKEKLLIQCKNSNSNIPVDEVRKLLGVVTSNKATKGVLVTSSDFTIDAIKFVNENPSLELINYKQLSTLFNEQHGPYWIYKIENIIRDFINPY
jgi:restriction system protein